MTPYERIEAVRIPEKDAEARTMLNYLLGTLAALASSEPTPIRIAAAVERAKQFASPTPKQFLESPTP